MKYSNGTDVRVGDRVQLWEGCQGAVVCAMDTDEYSPDFPKKDWSYLKSGVMIKTDKAGLIHYVEADEDLRLIKRAGE